MDFGLVFPSLVAIRLLLAFTPLHELLQHDHQLASPLTSYPRCALFALRLANYELTSCFQYEKGFTYFNMALIPTLEAYSDT